MAVHVDQVTSEVISESEPTGGSAAASAPESLWETLARYRATRKQALEDAVRTRAEAYDD
jgi:hypothetical protein